MKKLGFILIAIFFLSAISACANPWMDVDLTWDLPIEYEDGSPIKPGDLSHCTVLCGTAPDFSPVRVNVGLVTRYSISNDLPPGAGAYDCVIDVTSIAGATSVHSNIAVVTKVGKSVKPATNNR